MQDLNTEHWTLNKSHLKGSLSRDTESNESWRTMKHSFNFGIQFERMWKNTTAAISTYIIQQLLVEFKFSFKRKKIMKNSITANNYNSRIKSFPWLWNVTADYIKLILWPAIICQAHIIGSPVKKILNQFPHKMSF